MAETKIIKSKNRVFERFDINQSESSIFYWENFIFFDITQPESSIIYKEKILYFVITTNQNGVFAQNGVFSNFDIQQSESSIPSLVVFVVLTNQNELFIDFEIFFRSKEKFVHETF